MICDFIMQVESSDLISYGLIPEFIGRFPVLVSLSALNEDQLIQVSVVFSMITSCTALLGEKWVPVEPVRHQLIESFYTVSQYFVLFMIIWMMDP